MKRTLDNRAFSRFEIGLCVIVLGTLAVVALPHFVRAESDTRISACANQLERLSQAFSYFQATNGYWPPDTVVGKLPPEMRSMLKSENPFEGETPIGGQYDYENKKDLGAICIVIRGSNFIEPPTIEDAEALDTYIDDGNLRSGNFRAVEGGYAYAFDRK